MNDTEIDRFVRPKELEAMLGLTGRAIRYLRERGDFPQPRQLSSGPFARSRAVGWPLSEIREWMQSRPMAQGYARAAK